MFVIEKTSISAYRKVGELGEGVTKLLADIYIKKKVVRNEDQDHINTKLKELREKDQWILCDCRKTDPPVMGIRKIGGKFILVHLNNRGRHEEWCEFKERIYDDPKRKIRKKLSKGGIFHIHRKHIEKSSSEEQDSGPANNEKTEKHYSRLARILYTLMSDAGINVMSVKDRNINDQYKKIKQMAGNYNIEKGIDGGKFLWTHPEYIGGCYLELRNARHYWPGDSRPYGIFIIAVDSFSGNTVKTRIKEKEYTIKLNGILKKSSERVGQASGPFLLIFTVTDMVKKRGFYIPYNGFIVPVLSKADLYMVDNNFERRLIYWMKNEILKWQKMGIHVEIEKPVFESLTVKGEKVRPDFLIKSEKKNVIVEVLGSNETEYRIRKKKEIESAKDLETVIVFDAVAEEINNSWDQGLYRLSGEIIEKLI